MYTNREMEEGVKRERESERESERVRARVVRARACLVVRKALLTQLWTVKREGQC